MEPNLLGMAGAALASGTIAFLDLKYPRQVERPVEQIPDTAGSSPTLEPAFTSHHGSRKAAPRERMFFRWGLSTAAVEYALFALWAFRLEPSLLERAVLLTATLAAAALIVVANIPYDDKRRWMRAVHGAAAVMFFTLSCIVAGGFALTLPSMSGAMLLVLMLIFAPIGAAMAFSSVLGLCAGVGIDVVLVVSRYNAALRGVESIAAFMVGLMMLVSAYGWSP